MGVGGECRRLVKAPRRKSGGAAQFVSMRSDEFSPAEETIADLARSIVEGGACKRCGA
jgi:hypothetical protein